MKLYKRIYGVTLVAMMGCTSLLVTNHAMAFDDDTHYYLTYYIARKVGYTSQQAYRIANANIAVDYAAVTEPFQIDRKLLVHPAYPIEKARIRFHAFQDQKRFGEGESAAGMAAIKEIERWHWDRAKEFMNPGIFLHFLQDEFSHSPLKYASRKGHAEDGHLPDFLSYDPLQSERMARETLTRLQEFWNYSCLKQKRKNVNYDRDIRPVLEELIHVNPYPAKTGNIYSEEGQAYLS